MNWRGIGKRWALALAIGMAPVWTHAATAAPAREIAGTVTKVSDGDSLWLQPAVDGPPVEVRLVGIDAPEICQAWGTQSRDALKALVEGQRVTLRTAGVDTYQRTLGSVLLDGLDVNVRMVEEGHAWSTRTKWDRGPLVKQERMAKALGRGLHSQAGAVMPKDFRAGHGPCNSAAGSPPLIVTPTAVTLPAAVTSAAYRCDGRTHCSQMTSCAEATYFLRHCPGVKMDGNNDGVPCEKQWCRP